MESHTITDVNRGFAYVNRRFESGQWLKKKEEGVCPLLLLSYILIEITLEELAISQKFALFQYLYEIAQNYIFYT